MADDLAALAELAGSFIHEIKNHLGTIGLNLQLLAEDFPDPQTTRERRACQRLRRLQEECQHLTDLANNFLHFARLKDLELEIADLGKVVEEMIDFFSPTAKAANIDIKSYVSASLPPVRLHREMLQQALLNLMLNAEQAMPQGGELILQASLEQESQTRTQRIQGTGQELEVSQEASLPAKPVAPSGSSAARSWVCLSLIDTGQGMSPEVLSKVFKPFFSTRPGGTGLGLLTTRKIIEAHHGFLEVQSEVGHGTKFTIRLAVANEGGQPGL